MHCWYAASCMCFDEHKRSGDFCNLRLELTACSMHLIIRPDCEKRRSVWVRIRAVVWIIAGVLLLGFTGRAWAQYTPPSDRMVISAQKAVTWSEDSTTVI